MRIHLADWWPLYGVALYGAAIYTFALWEAIGR